jgi:hypothetical protein
MSCSITNEVTLEFIKLILGTDQIPKWGQRREFGMDTQEAQALLGMSWLFAVHSSRSHRITLFRCLGSPNGKSLGYFLAQHKTQLGDPPYYISGVAIFGPDNERHANDPYLLFKVVRVDPSGTLLQPPGWKPPLGADALEESKSLPQDRIVSTSGDLITILEPRIVKRSVDGKNVVREHMFRAML